MDDDTSSPNNPERLLSEAHKGKNGTENPQEKDTRRNPRDDMDRKIVHQVGTEAPVTAEIATPKTDKIGINEIAKGQRSATVVTEIPEINMINRKVIARARRTDHHATNHPVDETAIPEITEAANSTKVMSETGGTDAAPVITSCADHHGDTTRGTPTGNPTTGTRMSEASDGIPLRGTIHPEAQAGLT